MQLLCPPFRHTLFRLGVPTKRKKAWDPVVTRISLSLRPLER
jgi:hypothetical protein